jgi:HAMP domain-containing protein
MIDRIDDISIQKKLVGTFAIVFLVGVVALGWNVYRLGQVKDDVTDIVDRADELLFLQIVEIQFRQLEGVERDYVLAGDPSDTDELIPLYNDIAQGLAETLKSVREESTGDDITELVDRLETERQAQMTLFGEIVALVAEDPEAARQLSYDAVTQKVDNIYDPLYAVVEEDKLPAIWEDFDRSDALLQSTINIAIGTIVLFAIIGLVIAVVVYIVSRRIVEPVITMADVAQSIEDEEFKIDALQEIAPRQDEIGQLARVIERMAKEVKARVEQLRQQVTELQIVIDRGKVEKQVSEITDSDYFQSLQSKVKNLRQGADQDDTKAE